MLPKVVEWSNVGPASVSVRSSMTEFKRKVCKVGSRFRAACRGAANHLRPSSSTPENGRFRETIKLSASAGGWKEVASPTEVAECGDSMASKNQRAIIRGLGMTALRLPSAKPQRQWFARLGRAKRGTSVGREWNDFGT
jgi:hypothetical protein